MFGMVLAKGEVTGTTQYACMGETETALSGCAVFSPWD
jgi:hypothetical protein